MSCRALGDLYDRALMPLHAPRPLARRHHARAVTDAGISCRGPMAATLLGLTCGSGAHVPSQLCGESRVCSGRGYPRGELIGGELRETSEGLWTCVHRPGEGLQTILKDPREAGH